MVPYAAGFINLLKKRNANTVEFNIGNEVQKNSSYCVVNAATGKKSVL
jgi:hypothetical protein